MTDYETHRPNSEDHEVLCLRAAHNVKSNAGIEGDKPATVFYRQGQQVSVGDLLVASPPSGVENLRIRDRQIVGPELMIAACLGGFELGKNVPCGHWGGLSRIG